MAAIAPPATRELPELVRHRAGWGYSQLSQRYVPERVTNQIKQGFSGPDASWFRGDSIDYIERELLHRDAEGRPGSLHAGEVTGVVDCCVFVVGAVYCLQ